jgi:hypothetical protein
VSGAVMMASVLGVDTGAICMGVVLSAVPR